MDVFGSRLKMRLSLCMSGKLNEKQVLCFSSCAGTVLQFTEVRLTKYGWGTKSVHLGAKRNVHEVRIKA